MWFSALLFICAVAIAWAAAAAVRLQRTPLVVFSLLLPAAGFCAPLVTGSVAPSVLWIDAALTLVVVASLRRTRRYRAGFAPAFIVLAGLVLGSWAGGRAAIGAPYPRPAPLVALAHALRAESNATLATLGGGKLLAAAGLKPSTDGPASGGLAVTKPGVCTPPLGSWIDLQRISPGCRPFGPTSPLNRDVGRNPQLMPNSARMIGYLLKKTGIPEPFAAKCAAGADPACAGEHADYGHPIYAGRAADPVWTIHCTNPYGGACTPEGVRIHIPADARPAGGTDHHFGVVDQTTQREYDFWGFCYGGPKLQPDSEATDAPLTVAQCKAKYGGRLQTLAGVDYDLDAAGIWSTHLAGRRGVQPDQITTATASGIALLAGAARTTEFAAGTYPHHAGFMVLPCSNGSAVYPISHFDTPCSQFKATNPPCSWDPQGDCGIPYGARWFIDLDDTAIDGCTDGGTPCAGPLKATLKMLAHYGMFFGDTNGEYGWSLNGLLDDWADQTQFGTVPTYTLFAAQGLTKRDGAGNLVVAWPSWMDAGWFAVHSHFADPCVSRGDCPARASRRSATRVPSAHAPSSP